LLVYNTDQLNEVRAVITAHANMHRGLISELPEASPYATAEGLRCWLNSRRDLKSRILEMIKDLKEEESAIATLENFVCIYKPRPVSNKKQKTPAKPTPKVTEPSCFHWRRRVRPTVIVDLIQIWNAAPSFDIYGAILDGRAATPSDLFAPVEGWTPDSMPDSVLALREAESTFVKEDNEYIPYRTGFYQSLMMTKSSNVLWFLQAFMIGFLFVFLFSRDGQIQMFSQVMLILSGIAIAITASTSCHSPKAKV